MPFRLTRPIDTRSHRRRVASSLATAIAIPCSRGCAPTAARRSRHDAARATSDERSLERLAQGSASSQPAPQRNCSATIAGVAAGRPAVVVNAMAAAATGSLAVPSGRATIRTTGLRGTGIRTDPTGSNDHAALRIGAFGESREIADIEVARRPRHRQAPRACIDLPDEQQTRCHAGNAAALQRQPGGTKCHFVSRVQQSMPMRRRGRALRVPSATVAQGPRLPIGSGPAQTCAAYKPADRCVAATPLAIFRSDGLPLCPAAK